MILSGIWLLYRCIRRSLFRFLFVPVPISGVKYGSRNCERHARLRNRDHDGPLRYGRR